MDLQAGSASGRQQLPRPQSLPMPQHPGAHQQLPGIPPQAKPQQHPSLGPAARQHPQLQPQTAHLHGMGRPSGPTLAGAPSHPMPHGTIKQEGGGLQPGPMQMQRGPSPHMRSVSPAPGGLNPAQLAQQQQQHAAAMQQATLQQAQGMLPWQLYRMHFVVTPACPGCELACMRSLCQLL